MNLYRDIRDESILLEIYVRRYLAAVVFDKLGGGNVRIAMNDAHYCYTKASRAAGILFFNGVDASVSEGEEEDENTSDYLAWGVRSFLQRVCAADIKEQSKKYKDSFDDCVRAMEVGFGVAVEVAAGKEIGYDWTREMLKDRVEELYERGERLLDLCGEEGGLPKRIAIGLHRGMGKAIDLI